ncbi:carbamoyltransferase [Mangrovimonas sp. CR14]|uniref:carbamoyltransferase family protein n=1 Tax=Mangrovimonas sp. CR14 TaxID=2706120 RepID=UPI0014204A64|nr:carbamoyltransferase C-terminal domain-containing protein [Mangrovimonas sp. CR14]NIK91351.1 carbamoyltransferase [Mangrovimonas sp. CR14]
MYILGINAFHADSSAALLKDGEVIYATEEERFERIKHWAGLPLKSIEFCLESEGITLEDVSAICIGRDPKAKLKNKIKYGLTNKNVAFGLFKQRFSNRNDLKSIKDVIKDFFGYCPEIKFIEHHRAHLASAFFSSPFEEAAVVSIDGSGDFSTVMIGKAKGSEIEVIESQDFPISIGIFYSAFTQFLGFPYYGDEYKVMGLSPYGNPTYLEAMRQLIWTGDKNILEWDDLYFNLSGGVISYEKNMPLVSPLFNREKFEVVFGAKKNKGDEFTQRHKDIACSLQRRTEELIFEILNRAYRLTGLENVCIAGGVAQNSVANGKILGNTPFENLYVPSAGHDAGISMGAAQYYFFNDLNNKRISPLFNANLGISFTNDQIKSILDDMGIEAQFIEDAELFEVLATAISESAVVGFFDGRAEFGPRALGSRSILADPRNARAQQLLNEKIKKRESFRPFAPSILEEYGEEYFENYQFTPFMERVLPIKEAKRKFIPAVTHVDGTGRLQSVRKELRPRYHALISKFHEKTGIPILINTSFNENEPVVNHPKEALDCFFRTNLDILVLGNYLMKKE